MGRCREEFHENTNRPWGGAGRRVTRVRGLTWLKRVTVLRPVADDGTSSNSSAGRRPQGSRGRDTRRSTIQTTTITPSDLPSKIHGMVNARFSRLVRSCPFLIFSNRSIRRLSYSVRVSLNINKSTWKWRLPEPLALRIKVVPLTLFLSSYNSVSKSNIERENRIHSK